MAETSAESNARLIIRHAFRVVAIVELMGKSLSLGRWDQCDIVLPHDAVSRLHARFVQGADGWHITDLNSVNNIPYTSYI